MKKLTQAGQSLTEYSLIAGIIGILAISTLLLIGDNITIQVPNIVNNALNGGGGPLNLTTTASTSSASVGSTTQGSGTSTLTGTGTVLTQAGQSSTTGSIGAPQSGGPLSPSGTTSTSSSTQPQSPACGSPIKIGWFIIKKCGGSSTP